MVVTTKEELENAQKSKAFEIIIAGELAKQVKNGRNIVSIGTFTLIALTGAIAAIPITGGISAVAFVPVAALTGLEIALIIAVVFVGVALLTAIWKEYEEIEYSHSPPKLVLRRKK